MRIFFSESSIIEANGFGKNARKFGPELIWAVRIVTVANEKKTWPHFPDIK